MDYRKRIVEDELDALRSLPALAIEGPKGVGKTATALTRARTTYRLDDPGQLEIIRADPSRLTRGEPPILIDEWQRYPESWDVVRRAVDADRTGGRFLLTGSAQPPATRDGASTPTHSGAGRIVTVRMRPMTLVERGAAEPAVSLHAMLDGRRPAISGQTRFSLDDYVEEVLASGFPGLRGLQGRPLRASLDGYVDRIVERDFAEQGRVVRNESALRRWMTAYAAATATTATAETIRLAATAENGPPPARSTSNPYAEILQSLWIVDPLPSWNPTTNEIGRITGPPKHHLADPAIAARLLNASHEALVQGRQIGPNVGRTGTLLGGLFESLACLTVRVFAQAAEAQVSHYRTKAGEREIDFIVESTDRRVVAIESKLSVAVDRTATTHIRRLRDQLGDRFADGVVLTTGSTAYRDEDGIAVVPLALFGP